MPTQGVVGPVIAPGVAGPATGETNRQLGALDPQPLLAVTQILPAALPTVTLIEVVVEDPVHPGGNDHV